jgi:hypothetical protein
MAKRHELHAYDYVNRPYASVRDAVLANPLGVFRCATTAKRDGAVGGELHAHAGPLELGAEIAIEVLSIEVARSPDYHPATKLVLEWRALRRPDLFPTMRATLMIYALTPTETQLDLAGMYEPPLGVVGEALDAIAMHKIAEETVANFTRDVGVFLRHALVAA